MGKSQTRHQPHELQNENENEKEIEIALPPPPSRYYPPPPLGGLKRPKFTLGKPSFGGTSCRAISSSFNQSINQSINQKPAEPLRIRMDGVVENRRAKNSPARGSGEKQEISSR